MVPTVKFVACVLVLGLSGAQLAVGETFDVTVSSNQFTPSQLTISVGDTVRWTNSGGFHNVRADDESFRCSNGCDGEGGNGTPSGNSWTFSRTFTEADVIGYHCQPHRAVGMVGTITVLGEEPEPEPGEIGLAQSSISVDEGEGQVEVVLQRQNGSDGAVEVTYSTSDGSAVAGADYVTANGTVAWADGDASDQAISVAIIEDAEEETTETFDIALSDPTGGAALGEDSASQIRIFDDDAGEGAACTPGPTTLCLNEGGRFKVEITFDANQGAGPMAGQTIDFGQRDSGLFWFFNEENAEVLIKVLRGCFEPFNSYWVFFAATTDVQFDLVVTDTLAGQSRTYSNASGNPAEPVQDVTTFLTCP